MKKAFRGLCLLAVVGGFAINSLADVMIPAYPIVTVQATSPLATEPGNNPAVFTVFRAGNTNAALTVTFKLGGTASNSVDYVATPDTITLAAGQSSAGVVITPIDEPSAKKYKTVVLTLAHPSNSRGAVEFYEGAVQRAVAYIAYHYTNVPPNIKWESPTNGSSFLSLPNIELTASTFDSNGWVAQVQFFANAASLGTVTNSFPQSWPRGRQVDRYSFLWTNVPPGAYALTAIATDNAGLQTTAGPVNVMVSTNLPKPEVAIINPAKGAEFPDLAPINIYAAAGEKGGWISSVTFYSNTNKLGVASNFLSPQYQFHRLPFYFRWTNAPTGSNVLTAVATDINGTQATSAPVTINVSTNTYHPRHGW